MQRHELLEILADDIKAHHFEITDARVAGCDTPLTELGLDSLGVTEASIRLADRFGTGKLDLLGSDTLTDVADKIIAYKGDGFITVPTVDEINAEIQDILDADAEKREYMDGLEDAPDNVVPIR